MRFPSWRLPHRGLGEETGGLLGPSSPTSEGFPGTSEFPVPLGLKRGRVETQVHPWVGCRQGSGRWPWARSTPAVTVRVKVMSITVRLTETWHPAKKGCCA